MIEALDPAYGSLEIHRYSKYLPASDNPSYELVDHLIE